MFLNINMVNRLPLSHEMFVILHKKCKKTTTWWSQVNMTKEKNVHWAFHFCTQRIPFLGCGLTGFLVTVHAVDRLHVNMCNTSDFKGCHRLCLFIGTWATRFPRFAWLFHFIDKWYFPIVLQDQIETFNIVWPKGNCWKQALVKYNGRTKG